MDVNVTLDVNVLIEALHAVACFAALGLALAVAWVTRRPFGEGEP